MGAGLSVASQLSLALLDDPVGFDVLTAAGAALVAMGLQRGAAVREEGPLWRIASMAYYAVAAGHLLWAVAGLFAPVVPLAAFEAIAAGTLAFGLWRLGRSPDDPLFLAAAAGQVLVALPGPWLVASWIGLEGATVELIARWAPLAYSGCAVLLGLVFVRWGRLEASRNSAESAS